MSEIIQRVVEKIEIQGDREMVAGLDRVAETAATNNKVFDDFIMTIAELNDRMSTASASLEAAGKKNAETGEKVDEAGKKGSSGMGKLFNAMFKANLAALVVDKVLGTVVGTVTRLGNAGWNSAKQIDSMTGHVHGLALAMYDLGEGDPLEKFERGGRVAKAVLRELGDSAYRTSTPIAELEAGFAEASGQLAPMGTKMERILGLVDKTSAAAKVFGDHAESSIVSITNAISSGVLAGKKGLPAALKGMVGDLTKLKPEQRMKKIETALLKLGAPLDKVAQGPAEGFERLGIIASRYLGGIVLPLYDRIGVAAGRFAQWLKDGQHWWEETAGTAEDIVYSTFQLADGVWSTVVGVAGVADNVFKIGHRIGTVVDLAKLFFDQVEFIGLGWKAIGEGIAVLSDPNRGMGKLYTYSEAISLKWSEIADRILGVAEKLANLAVPDFIKDKIPGVGKFFDQFRKFNESRALDREKQGKRLAQMEAREGLDPLTNETRRLRRMAQMDARGLLSGLKGIKVEQNIGKIEIQQDFRNEDPDRVLVEFVKGLERLGESAIQSTVGGQATVYEGGV